MCRTRTHIATTFGSPHFIRIDMERLLNEKIRLKCKDLKITIEMKNKKKMNQILKCGFGMEVHATQLKSIHFWFMCAKIPILISTRHIPCPFEWKKLKQQLSFASYSMRCFLPWSLRQFTNFVHSFFLNTICMGTDFANGNLYYAVSFCCAVATAAATKHYTHTAWIFELNVIRNFLQSFCDRFCIFGWVSLIISSDSRFFVRKSSFPIFAYSFAFFSCSFWIRFWNTVQLGPTKRPLSFDSPNVVF